MSNADSKSKLLRVLEELGIHAYPDCEVKCPEGYPVVLRLNGGQDIWLDLPEPAMLSSLDPKEVGVAVVDALGFPSRCWGLAKQIELLRGKRSLLDTDLLNLLADAMRGSQGAVFLEGYRYFASPLEASKRRETILLVTNANDEQSAIRQATKSQRSAEALKRIGRALAMNQTLQPLCHFAVQEIASSLRLAAALIWCRSVEGGPLELGATIGANRKASAVLESLDERKGLSCIAEFVAKSREPIEIVDVAANAMTTALEAEFCYLKPGSLLAIPLLIGPKLVGVLELIGRAGDQNLLENEDLCLTIAEHLSLALNGAMMYEATERLALYDPLTSIANHRSMHGFLVRAVAEARRMERDVGVLMLDVDHFRSFNEEEGHDAGDHVLCMVADVLRSSVRPYDLAARYGGEEFTIIMPGNGETESFAAAERIRQRIEQLEYRTRGGRTRRITASIGCATFPQSSSEPAELLKAADIALFQAKRSGRNQTRSFDGHYTDERAETSVPLDKVFEWLSKEDLGRGQLFQSRVATVASHLCSRMGLSRSQEQILNALIYVVPSFLAAKSAGDLRFLQKLEAVPELRPLVPSLSALSERFDGEGPATTEGELIPLLGRIVSVLLAVDGRSDGFTIGEPGRFDPEVLALALELADAA